MRLRLGILVQELGLGVWLVWIGIGSFWLIVGASILVTELKPCTFRTPNMGYRMLYITSEKENCSPFKRGLHMEFENGGYVAVGGFAEDCDGNKQPYIQVAEAEIKVDNIILQIPRRFLTEQVERYDFLRLTALALVVNRKHIRLDHIQRLAIVQFMVSKDFLDDEIHDFFKTVYAPRGRRDYDYGITQSQIASARGFHERGGRPHPVQR